MLDQALLALLSRRSLTGYELTKRFYGSVAFCWHAYQSQIYSELRRLEQKGLVKPEAGGARPARRLYSLTEPGRNALRTWLRTPWFLRIWAVDLLRPDEARALLDGCRRLHEERLQAYRRILNEPKREHGRLEDTPHSTLVGPYLCLQQGIRQEEMYIRWCRWAQGRLSRRARRGRTRKRRGTPDLHAVITRADTAGAD